MRISERAKAVVGSLTLRIDSTAKQLKAQGMDVIGLGAGEPDFNTPAHIIEAAKAAMDNGQTKYTASAGTLELRKAICAKLLKMNALEYEPSEIVVSNGAKQAIYNALCALLDEGDEVIIPTPAWVSYPEMAKMAGGVPVMLPCRAENEFALEPKELKKSITGKTRVLILNSPNNPCGNVYPKQLLEQIAQIAVEYGIAVISDEIYEEFIYDGVRQPSIAQLGEGIKSQTVLINGVSKTYAMTGWRIGYSASCGELAKVMTNWQSHSTSNANSIAQAAALEAISGPQECVREMVSEFDKRRRYMAQRINAMSGVSCGLPRGAFYILADISELFGKSSGGAAITDSDAFCEALLNSKGVAVVPGSGFGAQGYIRVSYAASMENIEKGMDRMEEFIEGLR